MNIRKKLLLFSLLVPVICLSSCQSENDDYYVNGDSKYEKRELIEPYKTIKEDYYQQAIVNNSITDDAYLVKEYLPIADTHIDSFIRYVTRDSILLYGIYDIYEGAYICDFLVNYNTIGWFGQPKKPIFTVNGVGYYIGTQYVEPAVWKNGVIYNMQGAVDNEIIPLELVEELFGEYKFNERFKIVEGNLLTEFRNNLPPYKYEPTINRNVNIECVDNPNAEKLKKAFYKQMFYDKQIVDDRDYNNYYIPRLIEPRSILLYSSYKINYDKYFLSFMVNGFGLMGGKSNFYCKIGEHILNYPYDWFVYSSGKIYKLDDAFNKKIFGVKDLEKYFDYLELNTSLNEYPDSTYFNNLPGLNRA